MCSLLEKERQARCRWCRNGLSVFKVPLAHVEEEKVAGRVGEGR